MDRDEFIYQFMHGELFIHYNNQEEGVAMMEALLENTEVNLDDPEENYAEEVLGGNADMKFPYARWEYNYGDFQTFNFYREPINGLPAIEAKDAIEILTGSFTQPIYTPRPIAELFA